MDIYKDSTDRKVTLDVPLTPKDGTLLVTAQDGGKVVHIFSAVNIETLGQSYSVDVPFHVIDNFESFTIDWKFDYIEASTTYKFSRAVQVDVVTPLLSVEEVKSVIGVNKTDAQAREAEALVRYIICAHTGQKFSSGRRTHKLRGNDRALIELPNRLIQLESFNGFDRTPANLQVSENGWLLRGGIRGVPGIKADYYGLHRINGRTYNEDNVLPEWFQKSREYSITGVWGWLEVPQEVKAAAKILLGDYACDDSVYRDRYVDSISAVDWRIQFNSGAFSETGNVKADQLLSGFVLNRGWAVI